MTDFDSQVSDLFEAQSLIASSSIDETAAKEQQLIAKNSLDELTQEYKGQADALNTKVQKEILSGPNGEPSLAVQTKLAYIAEKKRLDELKQNRGSYLPGAFAYLMKRYRARVSALHEKIREYDDFIKNYVKKAYIPALREAYERAKREPSRIKHGIEDLGQAIKMYMKPPSETNI
jgi:hypothetical protein